MTKDEIDQRYASKLEAEARAAAKRYDKARAEFAAAVAALAQLITDPATVAAHRCLLEAVDALLSAQADQVRAAAKSERRRRKAD